MSSLTVANAAASPSLATTNRGPRVLWGWILIFLAAAGLYAATANRGIQWQDSGHFVVSIMTGQWRNPLGLALSHPLHHALGRLFIAPGWLEPSFAVTLVSAVCGALAVANVFGCVHALTGRRAAALYAAASLAVAHTFWKMSTVTEVYTLSAALLAAECWALVAFYKTGRRQWLWLMLLLNGLGIANHMQNALTWPVLVVVALAAWRNRQVKFADVAAGLLLWAIATLPYTGMVVAEALQRGMWAEPLRSAFFGESFAGYSESVFNILPSRQVMAITSAFTLLSFPNLFLLAALYGLLSWRRWNIRRGLGWALVAELALHAAFVIRYDVVDQYTFFLPVYVLLALFAGLGAARALERRWRFTPVVAWILLATTPVLYAVVMPLVRDADILDRFIRHKPYRDDYVYLLTPWAVADDSAERMSRHAVQLAGPRGVLLVEDLMARPAIEYQCLRQGQTRGRIIMVSPWRPEETAAKALAVGPHQGVVLVPLSVLRPLPELQAGLQWERVGDLFVRVWPQAATRTSPGGA